MKIHQWLAVFSLSTLISFGMAALYAKYFDSGVRFVTTTPTVLLEPPLVGTIPAEGPMPVDTRQQVDLWCDATGLHLRAPAGSSFHDVRCPPK